MQRMVTDTIKSSEVESQSCWR